MKEFIAKQERMSKKMQPFEIKYFSLELKYIFQLAKFLLTKNDFNKFGLTLMFNYKTYYF